ncbi:MAG: LLM class F420-dependent oxidoreductase [Anaerolineaceae bacterium]|nr:LLM class F420-dependent oxidoreductase [Anaerolineaceae bacterium]MAU12157.1 LLM class F420-dependent oxidoreductase [Anaerolineaceae bacterium]
MKMGAIFPHFEFGTDADAVRDFAQTAEGLGYNHIGADDHVIGPNPDRPGGWTGWVTYETAFYEPMTLFSFMAAVTTTLSFNTWILLLPQRQTVLVAKQAATLDILSKGRLRLGLGVGWNEIEYIALNADFHTRGKRVEEQVALLRQLWTQELVDFKSEWHHIPDAGINPLPVQRPIPLWFGGQSEPAIRRAARIGDGWMPLFTEPEEAKPSIDLLDRCLDEAGRSRADFGLEARIPYGSGDPEVWQRLLEDWQRVGATHAVLQTTNCGFDTPTAHMEALRRFAEATGLHDGGIQ